MTAELLDGVEVAALVGHGVTAYTVAQARRERRLVGTKIGRRWLYNRADVDQWIAAARRPQLRGVASSRSAAHARSGASA